MKELNVKDVMSISGGKLTLSNMTMYDVVPWVTAGFGAFKGAEVGALLSTYQIAEKAPLVGTLVGGTLGAIALSTALFAVGNLVSHQLLERIGN